MEARWVTGDGGKCMVVLNGTLEMLRIKGPPSRWLVVERNMVAITEPLNNSKTLQTTSLQVTLHHVKQN